MNQAVKASYQFDSSQTAGQMLRGLREHAGVELEVLAAAMKVPPQKIEALEQDNLVSLPAYFARGLSANICRYLDADPHPVLAKLPDDKPRIATDDESINAPFSPHRFGSGMRPGGVPPWAIAGAGLLAVGAEVAQDDSGQWRVTRAVMNRSARVLMEGWVRVPAEGPA